MIRYMLRLSRPIRGLLAGAGFLVLVAGARPAEAISGTGTTAATFLKIAVGPRAVAMGESYAGLAEDVTATYWNPAGLALLARPEFTAMHVFWLEDIFFEHLGAAFPLARGTAGVSVVYLNHGTLLRSEEGDTPDSPDRGEFSAANGSVTGAYALDLTPNMFVGGGVKVFAESIDANDSVGWAVDLGFRYRTPLPELTFGAVVQNLGPATRVVEQYFRLPLNFKVGFAYRPRPDLALLLDYNQLLEQDGRISLGAEYWFEEVLALRAGYRYQSAVDAFEYYEGEGTGVLSGVSAGVGVRYQDLRLDYAFVPYGFLGSTHRIALTYAPPAPAREASEPAPAPEASEPAPAPEASEPAPAREASEPAPSRAQAETFEQTMSGIRDKIERGELAPVEFSSGSSDLQPASLPLLDEVAAVLAEQPGLRVRIEGHTDDRGAAEANRRLSQERVDAVRAYLVLERRIDEDRLEARGYGETRPIADNTTAEGRGRNRRVEFIPVVSSP